MAGGGVLAERSGGFDQLVRLHQLRDDERLHGDRLLPRPHGERGRYTVSKRASHHRPIRLQTPE